MGEEILLMLTASEATNSSNTQYCHMFESNPTPHREKGLFSPHIAFTSINQDLPSIIIIYLSFLLLYNVNIIIVLKCIFGRITGSTSSI